MQEIVAVGGVTSVQEGFTGKVAFMYSRKLSLER